MLFEVQKGHFIAVLKTYSPGYWEWEEKYLMNSIILFLVQKNIS